MMVPIALLAVLFGFGIFRLAQDYVRRSARSFASAERAWEGVKVAADDLLKNDVPETVARVVLALMATAGCGCYVRGMLVSHYLPRAQIVESEKSGQWDKAFGDVDALPHEQRDQFSKLLAAVVVYDSFRNPLQGWLFRRLIKSFIKVQQPITAQYEAKMTALSVLSRKDAIAI